eukprot:TRINITY_DN10992_c0_g1_i2.p1 TRINITY_DN10992_c0_g1~~TRINITY_DN10992_c0_g1_i2.p1  ORF type:complete len:853 (-),score=89.02 TRINITY_DN10992_c0_g1_i2:31-2589(-)
MLLARNQLRALIYKNVAYYSRQKKTLVCQFIFPILCVIVMGGLGIWWKATIERDFSGYYGGPSAAERSLFPSYVVDLLVDGPTSYGIYPRKGDIGSLYPNGTKMDFFKFAFQNRRYNFITGGVSKIVPTTLTYKSLELMVDHALFIQERAKMPFASILTSDNVFVDMSLVVDDHRDNITNSRLYLTTYELNSGSSSATTTASAYHYLFDTYLSYIRQRASSSPMHVYAAQLPGDFSTFFSAQENQVAQYCGLAYTFALIICIPAFVQILVMEKQHKLKMLMNMMGLTELNYILGNGFLFLFYYYLLAGVVLGASAAFQSTVLLNGPTGAIIGLVIFWGPAVVSLSILFASIFNNERAALWFSYGFIIVIPVGCLFVMMAVYSPLQGAPPSALYLLSPFALAAPLCHASFDCSLHPNTCANSYDVRYTTPLGFLLVDTILCLLLAMYLEAVLPRPNGVRRHPLFFISYLMRKISRRGRTSNMDITNTNNNDIFATLVQEDNDVMEEQLRINDMVHTSYFGSSSSTSSSSFSSSSARTVYDHPLVVHNIQKTYQDGTCAVSGVSFVVNRGQCFGLLGHNGAGKTSLLSVLTGITRATFGEAWLSGNSLSQNLAKIHKIIGICPQHDILWPDLTVSETLLLCLRMRGNDASSEKIKVEEVARLVYLHDALDVRTAALSGGMRRRLSVAMALVGEPQVIFLDEPTTGLDIISKRDMWELLLKIRQDRCIILTTHDMEEAEILCAKIGIMSSGKLRCLGSPSHLKEKFGKGYSLRLIVHGERQTDADLFVKRIAPSSVCIEEMAGRLHYQIPQGDVQIGLLFSYMTELGAQNGVANWAITPSSLEDVFLTISERETR